MYCWNHIHKIRVYVEVFLPTHISGLKVSLGALWSAETQFPSGRFMPEPRHRNGSILITLIVLRYHQGKCGFRHRWPVFFYKGSDSLQSPFGIWLSEFLFCLIQGDCYEQASAWVPMPARVLLSLVDNPVFPSQVICRSTVVI